MFPNGVGVSPRVKSNSVALNHLCGDSSIGARTVVAWDTLRTTHNLLTWPASRLSKTANILPPCTALARARLAGTPMFDLEHHPDIVCGPQTQLAESGLSRVDVRVFQGLVKARRQVIDACTTTWNHVSFQISLECVNHTVRNFIV